MTNKRPRLDSDQQPVQTKAVRSRNGCLPCRARRKGCDKIHPSCSRCTRLNVECVWPELKKAELVVDKARSSTSRASAAQSAPASKQADSFQTFFPNILDSVAPASSFSTIPFPSLPLDAANFVTNSSTPSSSETAPSRGEPSGYEELETIGSFEAACLTTTDNPNGANISTSQPFPSTPSSVSRLLSDIDMFLDPNNSLPNLNTDLFPSSSNPWPPFALGNVTLGLNNPPSGSPFFFPPASAFTQASNISQQTYLTPKQRVQAVADQLPKAMVRALENWLTNQDSEARRGQARDVLPTGYVINLAVWTSPNVFENIANFARKVYHASSPLRAVIDSEERSWLEGPPPAPSPSDSATGSSLADEIVALPDVTFTDKLWAMSDLAYKVIGTEGANGYYRFLEKYEKYLLKHYKRNQSFNLSELYNTEKLSLMTFIWGDISRSMILLQPTCFSYHYTPTTKEKCSMAETLMGSVDPIIAITGQITTLRFMMDRDPNSRDPVTGALDPLYEQKALQLKKKVLDIDAIVPAFQSEDGSMEVLCSVAVQEMYRQTTLICLYQIVYRYPTGHPAYQTAFKEVWHLYDTVVARSGPTRFKVALNAPMFISATLANTPADRQKCLGILKSTAEWKWEHENIAFLEMFWKEVDRLGHAEWHTYASPTVGPCFF